MFILTGFQILLGYMTTSMFTCGPSNVCTFRLSVKTQKDALEIMTQGHSVCHGVFSQSVKCPYK